MRTAAVLWGEALFLRPQHFQLQDEYFESLSRHALLSAQPYAWGVSALEVDQDALRAGTLRLIRAEVIFADGQSYAAPDADLLPEPVTLALHEIDHGGTTFHLSINPLRRHSPNCEARDHASANTRYAITHVNQPDHYTDAVEAEIAVLRKRGVLKIEGEAAASATSLPLVRVRRLQNGEYELSADFMPPVQHIASSPRLMRNLRGLLDVLAAKVSAHQGFHPRASGAVTDVRQEDFARLLLLQTMNAGMVALTHLQSLPNLHPERLFLELLRLAGGLMTFSARHPDKGIPRYHHSDPGRSFMRIDELLRSLLETVISTRYCAIALNESKRGLYSGDLDKAAVPEGTALFLAVTAEQAQSVLIDTIPLQIKIGTPEDVEHLIVSATGGVSLVHATQLPPAVPLKPGACYFLLEPKGTLYERMMDRRAVAIYVPSLFTRLSLELIALRP